MTDDAIIHDRIMRRVHRIHFLSRLLRPIFIKAFSGLLLFGLSFSLVSIADVLANMPAVLDFQAFLHFIGTAFVHTEWAVKGIIIGLVVLGVLFLKDAVGSMMIHASIKTA